MGFRSPLVYQSDVIQDVDTGWVNPTYEPGWADFGSGYKGVQFRRIGDVVEFCGLATGTTPGTVMFYLPPECRPSATGTLLFWVDAADGPGRLNIESSGAVQHIAGAVSFVGLQGLRFYIHPETD